MVFVRELVGFGERLRQCQRRARTGVDLEKPGDAVEAAFDFGNVTAELQRHAHAVAAVCPLSRLVEHDAPVFVVDARREAPEKLVTDESGDVIDAFDPAHLRCERQRDERLVGERQAT